MRLRPLDFVVLAAALGVVGYFSFFFYRTDADSASLVVAIEGTDDAWFYPADAEETVSVRGPLGTTVVRIGKDGAYVVSSPCANQLCVAQGKIHRAGGWISCLPNRVMVTMQGRQTEIDGATW
jgi:hypothetical protein